MGQIKEQSQEVYKKYQKLTYASFREMANDNNLSKYEKIGFPDSYREGYEEAIFKDIKTKLENLCANNDYTGHRLRLQRLSFYDD